MCEVRSCQNERISGLIQRKPMIFLLRRAVCQLLATDARPPPASRLQSQQALRFDEDGFEILVGLTVAESSFNLLHAEHPGELTTAAEKTLYLQLRHKHLIARSAPFIGPIESASGEPGIV